MNVFKFFICLYFLVVALNGHGQSILYYNAAQFTIIGKKDTLGPIFHRVDTAMYHLMPTPVKHLFTHSSGLAICFRTNSPEIWAEWEVDPIQMTNMAPIGHSGLDLYIKKNKKWIYAGTGAPTGRVSSKCVVKNMSQDFKECILYLPIYNSLKELKIGIKDSSRIESIPNPFRKKIIVYGSSITQGASASRPGLTYPARLSRLTGYDFINLGLSGNGNMEKNVAKMLADIVADAFIIDCMPNMSIDEIQKRTSHLVHLIRSKHPLAPIIMLEAPMSAKVNFDSVVLASTKAKANAYYNEYLQLKRDIKYLYYIRCKKMTGENHDGTIDTVHPNDEGFSSMAVKLEKPILRILKNNGI